LDLRLVFNALDLLGLDRLAEVLLGLGVVRELLRLSLVRVSMGEGAEEWVGKLGITAMITRVSIARVIVTAGMGAVVVVVDGLRQIGHLLVWLFLNH
jgi:hypothetical protein